MLESANLITDPHSPELRLITELFHRIQNVLPKDQEIVKVSPETPAREALALLKKYGFSQVPVIVTSASRSEVLGMFSYRSFAQRCGEFSVSAINNMREAPADLPVDLFLERFDYADINEEAMHVFQAMDKDNGILIGTSTHLTGILTPMDFLRYLNGITAPFVLISEIELSLRALIAVSADPEQIRECATRSLSHSYKSEHVPTKLEEMSFDDYRSVVCHSKNWPLFKSSFGLNRVVVDKKLQEVCKLRNQIFHFKKEISTDEIEKLRELREWLLIKAREADLRPKQT